MSYQKLAALAERYGTPYFLYDADEVARRIERVRRAMQGQAKVYYAIKSNPNLGLLKVVSAVADGADISSGGELDQALAAGFDAERMSFAGPAKTDAELEAAVAAGVGAISVESVRELRACATIAERRGRPARVTLRINPQLQHRVYGLKMGGRAIQFGIDEEELPAVEALLPTLHPHLEFRGIHVYAGSQGFDVPGLVEGMQNTLRIARELEDRTGLPCRKINLGGGFGISHGADGRELDVEALGAQVAPILSAHRSGSTQACELIIELGRYLTAGAGLYVTRVISEKRSRGRRFFACDGGLNHHLAAAGTFGAALRSNFVVCNLTDPDAPVVTCQIAGPSCNPTDLIGVDVSVPEPAQGQLLGILRSGSYGLTASPILFLGRATPVELVAEGGEVTVGRRAFRIADFN
jgi:diaminopimelate decarboxylase